ncbi:MAG: glycosyltransferase [Archangium sp.]|nr:glycosyltransferase [Archangium sp.]
MTSLHIAVVSTFPPDRGNLAEYGFYISNALAKTEGVAHVTVLANRVPGAPEVETPLPTLTIRRVWTLDEPTSFTTIAREAKAAGVDAVYVNAGIRTWGKSRRASMAGAALPLYLRSQGHPVITTLHTIGDTVRLDRMGVGGATKLGMRVASQLYLQSDLVTVTMPSMQTALRNMGATNVAHLSHGTWGARVPSPPVVPTPRILSFGFWGAFKDADLLVDATLALRNSGVPAELVLGGGAHPYFPEIYQQLKSKFAKHPFVRFTGYVPEAELTALFTSVSVVVLPYRTNAGASGVLNLCRSYGRPVVISNETALLEQLRFEGGAALVFDDAHSLVDSLRKVLTDDSLRASMGEGNLAVARRVTLETQAVKLARMFDDLVSKRSLDQWLKPVAMQPGVGNLVMSPPA